MAKVAPEVERKLEQECPKCHRPMTSQPRGASVEYLCACGWRLIEHPKEFAGVSPSTRG
jgi:hypothetical protein